MACKALDILKQNADIKKAPYQTHLVVVCIRSHALLLYNREAAKSPAFYQYSDWCVFCCSLYIGSCQAGVNYMPAMGTMGVPAGRVWLQWLHNWWCSTRLQEFSTLQGIWSQQHFQSGNARKIVQNLYFSQSSGQNHT